MNRIVRATAIVIGLTTLALACSRAPYTKRIQFNLIPNGIMNGIGKTAYTSMLGENKVARGSDNARTLTQVGRRIASAADEPKFKWEYSLIQEDTVNAWCLPGGKIGFYTGILPVLENEAGMAFVMGHEVGHATARHGAERLSQQLALLGGLVGLEVYLSNESQLTTAQRAAILGAIGLGAEVGVMLPFSRAHESEADIIGLMYMSNAGYPPEESVKMWDRMAALGGSSMPTFLSTHPPHEKRKENLREWMPKARKRYQRNALNHDTLVTLWEQ
ncbi:MAG: M48 family metallopeptidase [Deltaproteobacteria bacterium]|nr:M48 family metallopeptidase [Deltaproteobacteria bacterium]MBW2255176.1 M48 family metallopeptidase [Deltaproteobacteria bacterium]